MAEAAPVDLVTALPGPGASAALLARAGFLPSPFGALSFGVKVYRPLAPDPQQRGSWTLSLGDLDRLQLC